MVGATAARRSGGRRLLVAAVAAAAIAVGSGLRDAVAEDRAASASASESGAGADEATFVAAYVAGRAARKAAADLGFEWRNTKNLLRSARKLAKKGEFASAIELANQARRQGELAVLQAREQAQAWKEMVVK